MSIRSTVLFVYTFQGLHRSCQVFWVWCVQGSMFKRCHHPNPQAGKCRSGGYLVGRFGAISFKYVYLPEFIFQELLEAHGRIIFQGCKNLLSRPFVEMSRCGAEGIHMSIFTTYIISWIGLLIVNQVDLLNCLRSISLTDRVDIIFTVDTYVVMRLF